MARQTIFVIMDFASNATRVPRIEARKNRNLRVKGIVKNRRNPATGNCKRFNPTDGQKLGKGSVSFLLPESNKSDSLHVRDELTNDERWGE